MYNSKKDIPKNLNFVKHFFLTISKKNLFKKKLTLIRNLNMVFFYVDKK